MIDERPSSRTSLNSNKSYKGITENPYVNVNGKEELPCIHEIKKYRISDNKLTKKSSTSSSSSSPVPTPKMIDDCNSTRNNCKTDKYIKNNEQIKTFNKNLDGNYNKVCIKNIYSYCTLPKNKKIVNNDKLCLRNFVTPPKRVTPDGTHIYYWCDLHKKMNNGNIFVYIYVLFIFSYFIFLSKIINKII